MAALMLLLSLALAACGSPAQQTAVTDTADQAGTAVGDGGTGLQTAVGEIATQVSEVATPAAAESPATGETPGATGSPSGSTGVGAATGDTSKGELLIYASLPLTGSSLGQTQSIVNGMNLALEERKGAAGGYKIKFQALDDATAAAGKWTPEAESANATKAINDKATVYLGTYNSGAAAISIPILNRAGIPMISPANTAPELTKKGFDDKTLNSLYPTGERNYFRVIPADDLQGPAGANWAKELGATKVYILHDNEVYGRGIGTTFQGKAKELGLEVVGFEGIDTKAGDYKSLADKITNSGADFVYFGGITQSNAGQLFKDLRDADEGIMLMGPDGILEEAFIKATGADAAEGVHGTFAGKPAAQLGGKGKAYYDTYKAKFNADPEAYSIFGYETMSVALQAIDKAGSKDPKAVLDALRNLGTVDGAVGTYSFDENGDTTLKTQNGYQVKNGKWEWVKELSAE
jgi:branched-chain amino acid transport system substrate-binding protein